MSILNSRGWVCAGALILAVAVGCNSKPGAGGGATTERHHEGDGHDHAAGEHSETGPHGGHLIELGKEDYHAELIHDETAHVVTIYILDGKAKESVPISESEVTINAVAGGAPKQFKLAAVSQPGESPKASSFRLESEELCDALDAPNANGRLAVTISGKRFLGDIEHHDHGDGGEHKHK
jgi:hypothetical protein